MRTLCRICGWPLIGTFDRCPWCEAVMTQRAVDTIPLDLAQDAEFMTMLSEEDQAMIDWHSESQAARMLHTA